MRLLFFCAAAFWFVSAHAALAAMSPAEKQVFDELNQERQKLGRPVLEWNERLAEAARVHSRLLADNDRLAHQFPGESTVPERLGATGVRFTFSGENVALTGFVEDI